MMVPLQDPLKLEYERMGARITSYDNLLHPSHLIRLLGLNLIFLILPQGTSVYKISTLQ